MSEVDVFLREEWPALGDSEALEKQLEQCAVSHDLCCMLIYLCNVSWIKFTK